MGAVLTTMPKQDYKWPFGQSDGGPESRPLVVDLENVLVAVVADTAAAERALQTLRGIGFIDETLRLYTSEQIVAYDEAFRSSRGIKERVVGALVDDSDTMGQYLAYAREGHSALWILVNGREDANRVIRALVDHDLVRVWFHGSRGLETIEGQ